jgi:hypothetical protein
VLPESKRGAGEMDKKIDLIITSPGTGPVETKGVFGNMHDYYYLYVYPHGFYGRETYTRRWLKLDESFRNNTQLDDLKVSMQLADMRGPVSSAMLDAFVKLAQSVATKLNREMQFSMPLDQVPTRAEQLYESLLNLCQVNRSDLEFGINYFNCAMPKVTDGSWQ